MKTMQQSDACLNHMLALKWELYTTETVQDTGKSSCTSGDQESREVKRRFIRLSEYSARTGNIWIQQDIELPSAENHLALAGCTGSLRRGSSTVMKSSYFVTAGF